MLSLLYVYVRLERMYYVYYVHQCSYVHYMDILWYASMQVRIGIYLHEYTTHQCYCWHYVYGEWARPLAFNVRKRGGEVVRNGLWHL